MSTYNNINQLILMTDGQDTTSYSYDLNGNMTSVSVNGLTDKVYTYDAFNRLKTANAGSNLSSYTYNGDNLRQTKTVNGITTSHVYDGSNVVADIGNSATYYVRGNRLALLKNDLGAYLYTLTPRGDVRKVYNSTSDVNDYIYTAYGESAGDNTHTVNPFGYTGEYTDNETGLIYLRNRYYDPELGMFITEDPIRDGLNWYAYCNGNPVMLVDPTGLKGSGVVIGQTTSYSVLDAKIIQMTLNDLGYTDMDSHPLEVDGIIGNKTTYAIKEFQKNNGLTVDGYVGDETWKAMGLTLNNDITDKLYSTVFKEILLKEIEPINKPSDVPDVLLNFYSLVKNNSPLDLKQKNEWKSRYFIFDGNIYRGDAPGNIAYGIAGNYLNIPTDILLRAAGIAQIQAGTTKDKWIDNYYGDDPYDQLCIMVGINYNVYYRSK